MVNVLVYDQGISAHKKNQPKKLTDLKTAGMKCWTGLFFRKGLLERKKSRFIIFAVMRDGDGILRAWGEG